MNAINGTSIDRLLNSLGAISILTNSSGTTEMGLHHKRICGDMGAVTTTNANRLIDPNGLIPQFTTEQRFPSSRLNRMGCWSRKSEGWISQD